VDLVYLASVLGTAAAVLLGRYRRVDPTKLALAKVKPTEPAAMIDGAVVIVRGMVGLDDPRSELTSPISSRQCVYWCVTFDELGISGDFVELGRSVQGVSFLVVSERGVARVVPDHARVAVPGAERIFAMKNLDASWYNDPGIRLARSVCKRPNYPNSSSLRMTEYVVTPDMNVIVQGYCTKEPDPKGADDVTGYRADVPMRPVLSGTKRSPLLLADSEADYKRVSDNGQ